MSVAVLSGLAGLMRARQMKKDRQRRTDGQSRSGSEIIVSPPRCYNNRAACVRVYSENYQGNRGKQKGGSKEPPALTSATAMCWLQVQVEKAEGHQSEP